MIEMFRRISPSFAHQHIMASQSYDSSSQLTYFLPNYEIFKHIFYGQLGFLLGINASARPYSYQGREGYLITVDFILIKVSTRVVQKSEY